ncbi:PAS domain-containing protein [Pelagibius sp. Alg239-R121]|uniref:PAS domain-containing protein n=1 Tax=Pelagibius sp. Alg239-R121 TaxID=2993448 RepID=UPI0024A6DF44|nr:PAS domain-containing protein [Pelagibius sp. Alg239-R121]
MHSVEPSDSRVSDDWGPLKYDPDLSFAHPLLKEAYELWQRLSGARDLPSRRDLDPIQIPRPMLPHIQLLDIEAGPPARYHWRLIGTHITNALGRDSTGKYWDELYDESSLRSMSKGIAWIQTNRRPIRCFGQSDFAKKHFQSFEAIEMPLSDNLGNVGTVWIVAVYS